MLHALTVTRWETLIGLTCLAVGALAIVVNPEPRTLFLGVLLAWQSSLYLAAPYYSLLSVREKPEARREGRGSPIQESRAARWALALVAVLVIGAVFVQFTPRPAEIPAYVRFLPVEIPLIRLLGLDPAPPQDPRLTPSPARATNTPPPSMTPTPPPRPTATLTVTPSAPTRPASTARLRFTDEAAP
jgi:hypothetical protein